MFAAESDIRIFGVHSVLFILVAQFFKILDSLRFGQNGKKRCVELGKYLLFIQATQTFTVNGSTWKFGYSLYFY